MNSLLTWFRVLKRKLFQHGQDSPGFVGLRGSLTALSTMDMEREAALDVLAQHGLRAHLYLPAVGTEDESLAHALRILAARGYIFTDREGHVVGHIGIAHPAADDFASPRRDPPSQAPKLS